MIPVRATYRRAEKPGKTAMLDHAVYADVPDALIIGTAAQTAADLALHAGDEENHARILRAIDRARTAGTIMTMD